MKIIALVNQKGGVAKTTTSINLGYSLSKEGRKVLLVDVDPQANLSSVFELRREKVENRTVYDCLMNGKLLSKCIFKTKIDNIDVVPSSIDLADAELELTSVFSRESVLKKSFDNSDLSGYDYVIFDCSPSLGLLTVNVMVACKEIIIPLEACEFSFEGINNLLKIVKMVKEGINFDLNIFGVLLTRVDSRTNMSKKFEMQLTEIFGDRVFKTRIHQNVKISEAHEYKKPVGLYDPGCKGSIEYDSLAKEVLDLE